MITRRFCLIGSVFAVLIASGTLAHADLLAKIQSAGVLRMATPQDSPPFGVPGPDMKIVGYDIDVANLLAEKLGVKGDLIPTTSGNRVPAVQTNRADIIVSSLGKNAEREQVLDFSVAYAPYFLAVYAAKGIDIKSPADLAGKSIGVTRGAIDDLELTKIAPPTATIQRFEDTNGQISAYMSGQLDIIVTANVAAGAIARQMPDRAPEMKLNLKNSPCYIGVPKGETALLEKINAIITEAKSDGTLNKFSQQWFHAELPAGF